VLGRVLFTTGSKIGVKALCRFFKQVRQAYGEAVRLVWVWDNWPVHFHPEVVAAAAASRIELLYLPTYAPWTNPIEKLWRQLHEELLSMHRESDLNQWRKAANDNAARSWRQGWWTTAARLGKPSRGDASRGAAGPIRDGPARGSTRERGRWLPTFPLSAAREVA
jgi:transposase